jgi:glycosyltransferase involved in cell wall biosynthesis
MMPSGGGPALAAPARAESEAVTALANAFSSLSRRLLDGAGGVSVDVEEFSRLQPRREQVRLPTAKRDRYDRIGKRIAMGRAFTQSLVRFQFGIPILGIFEGYWRPMRVLFAHQNCPGQFRHLALALARDTGNQVAFITQPGRPQVPQAARVEYRTNRNPTVGIHPFIRDLEKHVINGQGAAKAAAELRHHGFVPDVIYAHPGWGEALYLKDVFPKVPLVLFCEFFYASEGADVGFEPSDPVSIDDQQRVRTKNGTLLLSFESMDHGISPTAWQRSRHPRHLLDSISVIHDGINCSVCAPNQSAELVLPNGKVLSRRDKVVTYVARNLEPYRGFPTMMRAAAALTRKRSDVHVVIVGADGISYGRRLPEGQTHRKNLLEELGPELERVHFLGQLPYTEYLKVLWVSAAHVYLTVPFVLSWSMLEAMSAGCLVLGSSTPPVTEVIESGKNGILVDFFDSEALSERLCHVLDHPDKYQGLRVEARRTIVARYALEQCLAAQIQTLKAQIQQS